jgi:hypothetical protein
MATLAPTATATLSQAAPKVACITPMEKVQADADCRIADVKGLGALGFHYGPYHPRFPGLDACAVARMPVCPPAARPSIDATALTRTAVTPTSTSTSMTLSPALLKAMRPSVVAVPPPPMPVPEKKAFLGLGVGGLLALLAVGGGGAYLLLRKKKGTAS